MLLGRLGAAEAGDRRELLARVASATSSRARKPRRYMPCAIASVTPSICWSGGDRLLLHLLELGLADDVELPAGELRGEAHVLALAADGERELLVRDDELHAAVGLVDDDLVAPRPAGWRRMTKRAGSRSNGHDVDLLAAQLLHDGLHARALHADARADRIDVRVAAGDGDLASARRARGRTRRCCTMPS